MASIFKKLGGVFATLAPTIATMAGGPLAGSAVGALVKGLGLPEGTTPEQIEEHIIKSADPDVYAKIKAADQQYALQLKQMDIDAEKIAQADRESARGREIAVKDKTPTILAFVITFGFFGLLAFFLTHQLPPSNKDVFTLLVGMLGTAWAGIVTYYFGSSAGSAQKTDILSKSIQNGPSA